MISFTPLPESDHRHFAQDLFEEAFPEAERPPFSSLRNRDDRFHFLIATHENDDQPLGILSYWEFADFVYIEHFAIAEELRNQGLGKAVFLSFLSQQDGQVLGEVELPHDQQSEYRVEFYASMGFHFNPQPYTCFNYVTKEPFQMQIISKLPLDDEEFAEVSAILRHEIYHIPDL